MYCGNKIDKSGFAVLRLASNGRYRIIYNLRKLAVILSMVDGLGIISMIRVFESYGIEPYDYFVQENLQVNFTNDFG